MAEYQWNFGQTVSAMHIAKTYIWNNREKTGDPATNTIRFAGRTDQELKGLFHCAGLQVHETRQDIRGVEGRPEPFITYALKKYIYH